MLDTRASWCPEPVRMRPASRPRRGPGGRRSPPWPPCGADHASAARPAGRHADGARERHRSRHLRRSGRASIGPRAEHVEFVGQFWRLAATPAMTPRSTACTRGSSAPGSSRSPALDSRSRPAARSIEKYPTPRTAGISRSARSPSCGRASPTKSCSPSRRITSRCASTPSRRRPAASSRQARRCRSRRSGPDFAKQDVTGAVVLGDADPGTLWRRAVGPRRHRRRVDALGLYFARSARRAADAARQVGHPAVGQHPVRRGASRVRLQGVAARGGGAPEGRAGAVSVRVTIASTFSTNPTRTLVAEIPGRTAPTNASSSPRTCRNPARMTTRAASRR